jgi:hypothetical protein
MRADDQIDFQEDKQIIRDDRLISIETDNTRMGKWWLIKPIASRRRSGGHKTRSRPRQGVDTSVRNCCKTQGEIIGQVAGLTDGTTGEPMAVDAADRAWQLVRGAWRGGKKKIKLDSRKCIMQELATLHTVIRFVSISAKFGIATS